MRGGPPRQAHPRAQVHPGDEAGGRGALPRARQEPGSLSSAAAIMPKRKSTCQRIWSRFTARLADITCVKTRRGWLYLTLVMDIWSRRIAGWSTGTEHHRRASRRGIEDGGARAKPARRPRPSRRSRLAIRVAASVQDHAGERHPAVDGVDLVAVGQRRKAMGAVTRNRNNPPLHCVDEEAAIQPHRPSLNYKWMKRLKEIDGE